MATTFWTLFFMVMFLLIALLVAVFVILDGIRYHEERKQDRFNELSGQDPDWMKKD